MPSDRDGSSKTEACYLTVGPRDRLLSSWGAFLVVVFLGDLAHDCFSGWLLAFH